MRGGAALAALGAVAALGVAYLQPQARSETPQSASVPLVRAEPGPIKVKPADPGGLKVPHRDKSVYDQIESRRKVVPAGDAAKRTKAPPPKPGQKNLAQDIGPYRVQLGSFTSSELAQKEWQELRSKHADLIGGLQMVLERVEIKSKGTMVRLQAGPLKSPDDVQKLCSALAKRKVACLQVKS